jgi:hypothetical protein
VIPNAAGVLATTRLLEAVREFLEALALRCEPEAAELVRARLESLALAEPQMLRAMATCADTAGLTTEALDAAVARWRDATTRLRRHHLTLSPFAMDPNVPAPPPA